MKWHRYQVGLSCILAFLMIDPLWANAYFTPSESDLSVMFLGNIFGNMSTVLVGYSSGLMGTILGIFNLGVVVFAGGFVLHNVIRSAFGSAQSLEGSQGTAWSTLRIISGVGLMIPQFSGYSTIQVLVMWVVIKGIAVADYLWAEALDYANDMGGSIYQVTTPSDYDYTAAYLGSSNNVSAVSSKSGRAYINDYFASAVCLEAVREDNAAMLSSAEALGISTSGSAEVFSVRWAEECQISCDDAGADTESSYCVDGYASNVFCYGSTSLPTVCGGYAFGKQKTTGSEQITTTGFDSSSNATLKTGLQSVTMFSLSLGSSLLANALSALQQGQSVTSTLSSQCQSTDTASQCQTGEDLVMAASMYYSALKPLLVVDDMDTTEWDSDTNWYYTASQHGWIVAGMYYFNLVGEDANLTSSMLSPYAYQVKKVVARSFEDTTGSDVADAYKLTLSNFSTFVDRAKDIITSYAQSSLLRTDEIKQSLTTNEENYDLDNDFLNVDSTNASMFDTILNSLLVRSITAIARGQQYGGDYLQQNSMDVVFSGDLSTPTYDSDTGEQIDYSDASNAIGMMPNLYVVQINIHSMLSRLITQFLGLNILSTDAEVLYCSDDFCDPTEFPPDSTTCSGLFDACKGSVDSDDANSFANNTCWNAFLQTPSCLIMGQGIAGQIYATSEGYRVDPLRSLVRLGLAMVQTAVDYWVETTKGLMKVNLDLMWSYFGWSVMVSGLSTLINAVTPPDTAASIGGTVMSAVGSMVASATTTVLGMMYQWDIMRLVFFAPVGSAIAGVVFLIGVTLAYYVPIVPLVLFVFTVVGWFILVVEAVIAAPLLALGMTHPAGHDLLGRSEQALILLLGIFLRPATIILGLVAASVLSYNIITWVNLGFAMVLNQYLHFTNSVSLIDTIGIKLIGTVAVYVFYAYVMVELVTYTFSMIYQVPDRITRWIGGQPEYSSAQQMAGEIQGGLQGAAQGGAGGAGQVSGQGATHNQSVLASPTQKNTHKDESSAKSEGGGGGGNSGGTGSGSGGNSGGTT